MALAIYTHISNLKVLTKIFFKLSRPKGNLCGVTVLNPKYPQLSSGDTIIPKYRHFLSLLHGGTLALSVDDFESRASR